jgi:hypothetical protein
MATREEKNQAARAYNQREQAAVADWNSRCPVGTAVHLDGQTFTVTRSPAKMVGKDAMVWLRGHNGGYLLSRCRALGGGHE